MSHTRGKERLKKRALTPKQALIAPSFLSLLLSIELNSNIYIIHNQISSSSLLLAIIQLPILRNSYFISLYANLRLLWHFYTLDPIWCHASDLN